MANNILGNPWILDTANAAAITNNQGTIQAVKWVVGAGGVSTDTVTLTDENDAVKYTDTLAVDDAIPPPFYWPEGLFTSGLKLTVIGEGILYVYWKGAPPQ